MKIKPRPTKRRVQANRITSPETQEGPINQETGERKRILLLSYADERSNQQHNPTSKDLFLYAAGRNEVDELPDGLDRLHNHSFTIHLDSANENDSKARAVGIDIVPSQVMRSGVVLASQRDVVNATFVWELDGAVCRVTSRPAKSRPAQLHAVIRELDKLIQAEKDIDINTRLGNLGTVVSVGLNTVEVRLRNSATSVPGATPESMEEIVASAEG